YSTISIEYAPAVSICTKKHASPPRDDACSHFKLSDRKIGLVPTAAAAAASAAAVTTAAATAAAATSRLARTGLVHGQRAAVVLLTVHAADRRLGFFIAAHFDEAETLAAAGIAIHDHFGALYRSVFTKQLIEI